MQRTFTAESLDAKVHFQLISLEKQLFVWADAGSARLSALVLAGTSTPVSPPSFRPSPGPHRALGLGRQAAPPPAPGLLNVIRPPRGPGAVCRASCRRQPTLSLAARATGAGAWRVALVRHHGAALAHALRVLLPADPICVLCRSDEDRDSCRLLVEPARGVTLPRRECRLCASRCSGVIAARIS